MPKLQVNDQPSQPYRSATVLNFPAGNDLDALGDELDSMLARLVGLADEMPDIVIRDCMAFMGRLTEITVGLVRIEGSNRRAKFFRTSQVQRVMDLCDFQFKAASRLVEVARQEVDLSR